MNLQAKNFWESKTLWFNAISAVVIIAGVLVDPSLGFDPRIIAAATAVVTVGNALLRLVTNLPIAGTPAANDMLAPPPKAAAPVLDTLPPTP